MVVNDTKMRMNVNFPFYKFVGFCIFVQIKKKKYDTNQ